MAKKKRDRDMKRRLLGTTTPMTAPATADDRKFTIHYLDPAPVAGILVPDEPMTKEEARQFRRYLRERFGR